MDTAFMDHTGAPHQPRFYETLLDAIGQAVIATDAAGMVTYFNHAAELMYGWPSKEAIGRSIMEVTVPVMSLEQANEIMGQMQSGLGWRGEFLVRRRNGTVFPADVHNTPIIDQRGTMTGIIGVSSDISQRKALEQTVQDKSDELNTAKLAADAANLAKSDFLSSMSHELRTPLNAVLGFAQLLEVARPPPTAQQQLSIGQILKAGWHLLDMVNEILDLSMIESRGVTLSKEVLSLATVLQDCQSMTEALAQQRGIKMTFPHFQHSLYVHADRTRLKQALINLLTNAIKYNRLGGAVNVECTVSDEGRVRIHVKDSGIGLSPEQLENLFQIFNRLGQEASATEGNGIGLVVTKRLVELMGGSIGVESTVGVGSDFWLELEAMTTPEINHGTDVSTDQAAATPVASSTPAPQLKVLYVEDNPANVLLIEQLVARHENLMLLTATDAHSGIQVARLQQPDVILMDINLPGISGYGALEILRADLKTAHIPVVALSANAMPSDIDKGLRAGFFRYVTKPIKIDEFMAALDVALQDATEKRQLN